MWFLPKIRMVKFPANTWALHFSVPRCNIYSLPELEETNVINFLLV